LGGTAEVTITLNPSAVPAMSREEAQKLDAFRKVFEAGIAASNAGNYEEAIAKFNEAATMRADCSSCLFQRRQLVREPEGLPEGRGGVQEGDPDEARLSDAYNALANVYNMEKKFDDAAKMTEEANKVAGGGAVLGANPDSVFNQGVIFWNAGKIPEAKKQFEETIKLKPDHADAHYWVGMADLNEGKIPDAVTHFEEYLKLAPTGQYADQARASSRS